MHDQATEPRSRKLVAGASLAVATALGFSAFGAPAAMAAEPTPTSQTMTHDSTAEVKSGDVALADAQNMFNDFMSNGGGDIVKEAEKAFNEFTQGGGGDELMGQLNGFLDQFNLPADPQQLIEDAPEDVLKDPNKFAKYIEEKVGVDVNHLLDTVGNTSKVAGNSQTDDGKESRNGAGLTLVDDQKVSDRLHTLTFESDELTDLQPKVNVLLPSGYDPNSDTEYPTIYLMHGGGGYYGEFMNKGVDSMVDDAIVVMPEGGLAGWYTDAAASEMGERNWETFHTEQLIPYIDANYNTINQGSARGISGFSMGGFGSLKYTAKHPEMFDAVTSFSGPADIRDRLGAVAHWANASGVIDNGSVAGMYGAPWDEEKVSADNPIENLDQYKGKRLHFYAGSTDDITEATVRAGHEKFDKALTEAGIEHSYTPFKGPHHVPEDALRAELTGMLEFLDSPGTYDDPEVTLSTGEKPAEEDDKAADKGSSSGGSSDAKDSDSSKDEDKKDSDSDKSKDDKEGSSNVSDKGDDKAAGSDKPKDDAKSDDAAKDDSKKDEDKAGDAKDEDKKDSDSDKSKDDAKADSDKDDAKSDEDKKDSDSKKDEDKPADADADAATAEKWNNFFDSILN